MTLNVNTTDPATLFSLDLTGKIIMISGNPSNAARVSKKWNEATSRGFMQVSEMRRSDLTIKPFSPKRYAAVFNKTSN